MTDQYFYWAFSGIREQQLLEAIDKGKLNVNATRCDLDVELCLRCGAHLRLNLTPIFFVCVACEKALTEPACTCIAANHMMCLSCEAILGPVISGRSTLLHMACYAKNLQLVSELLKRGASPNATTHHSETPLYSATISCSRETIAMLLAAGADPNITSTTTHTLLQYATIGSATEGCLCEFLESRKCILDLKNPLTGMTALHSAKIPERARMLLHCGASHSVLDNAGRTPLLALVFCKAYESAGVLLDRGANPNAVDSKGNSVLHVAVVTGAPVSFITQLIMNWRVNPSLENNDGRGALGIALQKKDHDMCSILIQCGARLSDLDALISGRLLDAYTQRNAGPPPSSETFVLTSSSLRACPQCSICLMDFDKDDKTTLLSCNHFFHKDCIQRWFRTEMICPLCRNKDTAL